MKGTMATEQEQAIEASLQAGDDRHTTRRALVSQGISTSDFEKTYTSVLTRLGIEEPKPPAVKRIPSGEVASIARRRKRGSGFFNFLLTAFLIVVIGGCVALLFPSVQKVITTFIDTYGNMDRGASKERFSVGKSIIETKVDATFASARIYKGKLLDYQGACTGVTVVAPVACKENAVSLVMYAPLAEGGYYCVDSSGGTGREVDISGEVYRCK
jgi:hypothetical protein